VAYANAPSRSVAYKLLVCVIGWLQINLSQAERMQISPPDQAPPWKRTKVLVQSRQMVEYQLSIKYSLIIKLIIHVR
jgi:hypothetical protein